MPLKPRDFVSYPRESSMRQNCMYVDFLACQYALQQNSVASSNIEPYLMDVTMLCQIMFPCVPNSTISHCRESFDVKLAKKQLLFAATWAIEQAAESDLSLYLLWFQRFGSKFKILFKFSHLLEKIRHHPVWLYMIDLYRELVSLCEVKSLNLSIPMLSVELIDEVAPNYESKNFIFNAINCLGLLKSTFKQWKHEEKYYSDKEVQSLMPMLGSLRLLEEDFLKKLVDLVKSLDFDKHLQTYENFLESHILYWDCIKTNFINAKKMKNKGTTESLGKLLIYWRSLLKKAAELKDICPEAAHQLLVSPNILPFLSI